MIGCWLSIVHKDGLCLASPSTMSIQHCHDEVLDMIFQLLPFQLPNNPPAIQLPTMLTCSLVIFGAIFSSLPKALKTYPPRTTYCEFWPRTGRKFRAVLLSPAHVRCLVAFDFANCPACLSSLPKGKVIQTIHMLIDISHKYQSYHSNIQSHMYQTLQNCTFREHIQLFRHRW